MPASKKQTSRNHNFARRIFNRLVGDPYIRLVKEPLFFLFVLAWFFVSGTVFRLLRNDRKFRNDIVVLSLYFIVYGFYLYQAIRLLLYCINNWEETTGGLYNTIEVIDEIIRTSWTRLPALPEALLRLIFSIPEAVVRLIWAPLLQLITPIARTVLIEIPYLAYNIYEHFYPLPTRTWRFVGAFESFHRLPTLAFIATVTNLWNLPLISRDIKWFLLELSAMAAALPL